MGDKCTIGFGSRMLGRVRLGNRVWIDANVTLYGNVDVEDHVYIGPNCTLGHFDRKRLKRMVAGEGGDLTSQGPSLKIGKDCTIRQGCIIYSPARIAGRVEFGHNVIVRENVSIGEATLVGTGVVIDGESSIGSNVSIQTGAYISRRSKVGDRVFLGPRCVLLNDKYMMLKKPRLIGPIVDEGSAIGGNSTLNPGVHVGKMAVIASGAVVTSNVPDKTVYAGVPAKKLKTVPSDWHSLLGRH
jgi:acetyltransferase-like isoleucine patch superfamily enzyme